MAISYPNTHKNANCNFNFMVTHLTFAYQKLLLRICAGSNHSEKQSSRINEKKNALRHCLRNEIYLLINHHVIRRNI